MTDKRCCKVVYGDLFGGRPCSRPVKYEIHGKSYCSIHNPDKVKERRAKLEAKWDAESKVEEDRWTAEHNRDVGFPLLLAYAQAQEARETKHQPPWGHDIKGMGAQSQRS